MKNTSQLISSRLSLMIIVIMIVLSACAPAQATPPPTRDYWPTTGWRSDTFANRGFDEAKLAGLKTKIEQDLPFLDSLLIIKDGYLVFEEYFNGYDASRLHPVHSVTKSFTSALIGLAQAEGKISNLDATLGAVLPDYFTGGQYEDKKGTTLRQLLMMRSGLDFDQDTVYAEQAARGVEFFLEQDLTEYLLNYPMAHPPGTAWNYSDADPQLLSAAFNALTGQSLESYAAQRLFPALGIADWTWPADAAGVSIGGTLLELTPRDMAKFGYLYLNQGHWNGQQIIPAAWVEQSTMPQGDGFYVPTGETIPIEFYGYLWWLWKPSWFHGHEAIHARGYGGQWIDIFPDLDLIVVSTDNGEVDRAGDTAQETAIDNLIWERILLAVKGVEATPR
jgi:CubicO group peptidase (beta-lactamase class C family)